MKAGLRVSSGFTFTFHLFTEKKNVYDKRIHIYDTLLFRGKTI
jgi:hypothetical protein